MGVTVVSPIALHIDEIKMMVAQLDDEVFELLKMGIAYYLNGVPEETDPEMILMAQDAMQLVAEFPIPCTIYELLVVVENEDHERAEQ
jgi:hypothetical protein